MKPKARRPAIQRVKPPVAVRVKGKAKVANIPALTKAQKVKKLKDISPARGPAGT